MMSQKTESYQQRKARTVTERGMKSVHRVHTYLVKKLFGYPIGDDLAQLLDKAFTAPPGYLHYLYHQFIRNIIVTLFREAPAFIEILSQRNGLRLATDLLCAQADRMISNQYSESDLVKMRAQIKQMASSVEKRLKLKDLQGDGKPPLGEELEVNFETAAREGWRLRAGIPVECLGLGKREKGNLEEALGMSLSDRGSNERPDQYAQTILPILLNLSVRPWERRHEVPSAGSRAWKWAGIERPPEGQSVSVDEALNGIANLLARQAELRGRQEMIGFMIGRELRHEYGLSKERGTVTFSDMEAAGAQETAQQGMDDDEDPWEPEDLNSLRGYQDVDRRMMWDALYNSAPPAQREALDIWCEADPPERTLAAVCRERGKDSNLVRNNLQAFIKSARKKMMT